MEIGVSQAPRAGDVIRRRHLVAVAATVIVAALAAGAVVAYQPTFRQRMLSAGFNPDLPHPLAKVPDALSGRVLLTVDYAPGQAVEVWLPASRVSFSYSPRVQTDSVLLRFRSQHFAGLWGYSLPQMIASTATMAEILSPLPKAHSVPLPSLSPITVLLA